MQKTLEARNALPTDVVLNIHQSNPGPRADAETTYTLTAAGKGVQPATDEQSTQSSASVKPRLHYLDWIRVLLTLIVVVHHCLNTYSGDANFWFLQQDPQDLAMQLLNSFFAGANQVRRYIPRAAVHFATAKSGSFGTAYNY